MDIKSIFDKLHDEKYNFKGLYSFIVDNEIPIEFVGFKFTVLGMAAYDKIYISKTIARDFSKEAIFFVIGHEVGHYMSFKKRGYQYHLDILSSTDFDIVFNHVIHEEILADKFSGMLFYALNHRLYDGLLKQHLHLKNQQMKYKPIIRGTLFGLYSNDIGEYEEAVESLIVR